VRQCRYPIRRCELCGAELDPCPARFDGEGTYCGFYPCQCDEARAEDSDRQEWIVSTEGAAELKGVRWAIVAAPTNYKLEIRCKTHINYWRNP
jgi:hypothetical protein